MRKQIEIKDGTVHLHNQKCYNKMKQYYISMEIAGPYALFNRNDVCGNCERSYPCPSYSAVINMFGSIATFKDVKIIPIKIEICKPLLYYEYKFNESNGDGSNNQITQYILNDVCYKLYARLDSNYKEEYNPRHAFQDRFNKRLKYHRKLHNPFLYLGHREFGASYFGPCRNITNPCVDINCDIYGMFKEINDKKEVITYPYLQIKNGTLIYD